MRMLRFFSFFVVVLCCGAVGFVAPSALAQAAVGQDTPLSVPASGDEVVTPPLMWGGETMESDAPHVSEDGEIIAPFVHDDAGEDDAAPNFLSNLYTPHGVESGSVPLSRPHRHKSQIAEWLEDVVAQALTIYVSDIDSSDPPFRASMNDKAWRAYEKFLDVSNARAIVRSNKLDLISYVDNTPVLVTQGVVNGRYRWLFEVPVTMSFVSDYDEDEGIKDPVNWYVNIDIQVGRVASDGTADDIVMENWTVEVLPGRQK